MTNYTKYVFGVLAAFGLLFILPSSGQAQAPKDVNVVNTPVPVTVQESTQLTSRAISAVIPSGETEGVGEVIALPGRFVVDSVSCKAGGAVPDANPIISLLVEGTQAVPLQIINRRQDHDRFAAYQLVSSFFEEQMIMFAERASPGPESVKIDCLFVGRDVDTQ